MMQKRSGSGAVLGVTILLGLAFSWIGFAKIINWGDPQEQFKTFGYPDWFCTVVGAAELIGGVLLLASLFYPRAGWLGASLLAVIMVGAVVTLLRAHQLVGAAFPALLFISLSSLAYYRFPRQAPPA